MLRLVTPVDILNYTDRITCTYLYVCVNLISLYAFKWFWIRLRKCIKLFQVNAMKLFFCQQLNLSVCHSDLIGNYSILAKSCAKNERKSRDRKNLLDSVSYSVRQCQPEWHSWRARRNRDTTCSSLIGTKRVQIRILRKSLRTDSNLKFLSRGLSQTRNSRAVETSPRFNFCTLKQ